MANPHFGVWPSDDETFELDAFGTVPSAEEEFFEKRFRKKSNRDLNELMVSVATGRPVKIEDREKLIVNYPSLKARACGEEPQEPVLSSG